MRALALALALLLTLSAMPALSEEYAVCYKTTLAGTEKFGSGGGAGVTDGGAGASAGAGRSIETPIYRIVCVGPYEVDPSRRRMCPKGVVGLRFKTLQAARWWMDDNCAEEPNY